MVIEQDTTALVLLALGSLVVGLVGGTVGIALGIIRLPLMTALGVDPLIAGPVNLGANFLGSLAAAFPHFYEGRIVWRVVLLVGAPAVGGAFIGGRFAHVAPEWALLLAVGLLLVWSGAMITWRAMTEIRSGGPPVADASSPKGGQLTTRTMVREGGIGILIGVVGGAVGLALGVLRMPALVSVFKMDPLYAAGTNLVMTVLISTAGFAGHSISGRIDWQLFGIVGGASAIGMYVGARMAGRLRPSRLRLFIGLVLVLIAPAVLWDALQRA